MKSRKKVPCQFCNEPYATQGLKTHEKACQRNAPKSQDKLVPVIENTIAIYVNPAVLKKLLLEDYEIKVVKKGD